MATSIAGPAYAFNVGDVLELVPSAQAWPSEILAWLRNGTARTFRGKAAHVTVIDPVTFGHIASTELSVQDVLARFGSTAAELHTAQAMLNFPPPRLMRTRPYTYASGLVTHDRRVMDGGVQHLWRTADVEQWRRALEAVARKVSSEK
jgi:hypothetical protein